ncbi:alpha/beta hydrolase [Streptomyces sp. NPDC005077]|uniref:alpha/beta fold hydrolase n=1 Tax=unclassified Streptomyces TaxID=2593676 RepID=UPI0033BCAFFD
MEKAQQVIQVYPDLPLSLTKVGAGKLALVLHAGHGPSTATPIVEHLARDHQVLAPTHPGWEGTPRPDWFDGVDDLAIAYLDLLEDEGLTDVTVVAASFGGWVASELVLRDRGQRIGRLILIDAAGSAPSRVPPPGDPMLPDDDMMKTLLTYGAPTFSDSKLLRRLSRVKIPVLVLWGEDDDVVTAEEGRAHAAAFANARFELLPDVSHMAVRDDPEAVFSHIDAFLAES